MEMIVILCCILGITLYVLNRKYFFSHDKKMIDRIMKNMVYMENELIGWNPGKYIGYCYEDKNNNYKLYVTKTSINDVYNLYKRNDEDMYDLVAKWKFNNYNFFSKIFNVEVNIGFKFEDMKEWIK